MNAFLGLGAVADADARAAAKALWVTEDRGLHHAVTWHELTLFGNGKHEAGVTDRTPYGSLPQRKKCGVSSFSRVARVRVARKIDLAATLKAELTATFFFRTAGGVRGDAKDVRYHGSKGNRRHPF